LDIALSFCLSVCISVLYFIWYFISTSVVNKRIYYSLIVTLVLSCTVSEIRRLIGWKLRIFPTPLSFIALARGWALSNFWTNFFIPKTRVLGLSVGENFVILACVVFTQCQCVVQTDREADRQTDNPIVANTGLCIAKRCLRTERRTCDILGVKVDGTYYCDLRLS